MINCNIYGKTNNIRKYSITKENRKAFIGFLPIPITHNQIERKNKNFQLSVKQLFYKVIAKILNSLKLQYNNSIYIYINNQPK